MVVQSNRGEPILSVPRSQHVHPGWRIADNECVQLGQQIRRSASSSRTSKTYYIFTSVIQRSSVAIMQN